MDGFELVMGQCHFQQGVDGKLYIVIQERDQLFHRSLDHAFASWRRIDGIGNERTPSALFDDRLGLIRTDSVPCALNFAVDVDEGIHGQFSCVRDVLKPLPKRFPVMKDFLGRTVQIIAFLIRKGPVQLVVRRKDVLNGATGFRLPEGNRIHKQGLVRQRRCQSLQLSKPPARLDEFRAHFFIQIRIRLWGQRRELVKGYVPIVGLHF